MSPKLLKLFVLKIQKKGNNKSQKLPQIFSFWIFNPRHNLSSFFSASFFSCAVSTSRLNPSPTHPPTQPPSLFLSTTMEVVIEKLIADWDTHEQVKVSMRVHTLTDTPVARDSLVYSDRDATARALSSVIIATSIVTRQRR